MQQFVTIHPKYRKYSIVQFHCQHYGFVVFDLSTIEHSLGEPRHKQEKRNMADPFLVEK